MKTKTLLILLLLSNYLPAQDSSDCYLVSSLFGLVINYNSDDLGRNVTKFSVPFSEWDFDGDYSSDRINGSPFIIDSISNDTIGYRFVCALPITFETPLYSILSNQDPSYDSLYYVGVINDQKVVKWKKNDFNPNLDIRLLEWPTNKLIKKSYSISSPLLSKDGSIAILLVYHQTKKKERYDRNDRIFIFEKGSSGWSIITVIKSNTIFY